MKRFSVVGAALPICVVVILGATAVSTWTSTLFAQTRTSSLPAVHKATVDEANGSWLVIDRYGTSIDSSNLAVAGKDLYVLGTDQLWRVADFHRKARQSSVLAADPLAANVSLSGIPIQEFNTFTFCPGRNALIILDKSGDLFEYAVNSGTWHVFNANRPITGAPDPDFVDITSLGSQVALLDPERNQIWRLPMVKGQAPTYFREVLPWRVKPGDPYVGDGLAVAFDGDTYVVKHNRQIVRISAGTAAGKGQLRNLRWSPPKSFRPSRIATAPLTPLYVVERENNRVLAIDKKSGHWRQFLFNHGSDLRGILPERDGFWILNGHTLTRRSLASADPRGLEPSPRRADSRLDGVILPIASSRLPRHPGVFPGARRLYRYGVHMGIDFFAECGCRKRIVAGTPVRAVEGGKVMRADLQFKDMDGRTFARVLRECLAQHRTSLANEDRFRGCQVWIDHGNGFVTKYAHLSAVRRGTAVGKFVSRGDVIGYVGYSGTGQHLPGHTPQPHLHFETWLDGHYLGYGLTPAETIGLFEDIFGTDCPRGS